MPRKIAPMVLFKVTFIVSSRFEQSGEKGAIIATVASCQREEEIAKGGNDSNISSRDICT